MTRIRLASSRDRDEVRELHLCAFTEGEKQRVATLAVDLLSEDTDPETISLLAESDAAVVGHVAFSPVTVSNNKLWQGYILAPLGVRPEYQKRRIGSKLVESGIERLSNTGVNILFVYGDPEYYGRFGFNVDLASGYLPPYELQYPFGWQALVLNEDVYTESTVKIACVDSLNDAELW